MTKTKYVTDTNTHTKKNTVYKSTRDKDKVDPNLPFTNMFSRNNDYK